MLNFKGIPYRTVWVEYPDIEATCKKIGALPTGVKLNGSPLYTLPVIHDPHTGATISDSALIAEYLYRAYPAKSTLIPAGTQTLQAAFRDVSVAKLTPLWQLALPKMTLILGPRSEEYYRRTKLPISGMTMEEMYPCGEKKNVG
ncbi:hypothetical protein Moror_264 [Moniliophthora roreri MCA 2997]|uniref:GST N-terminal domain-containing protein n=1 Tax=Moniliophthora roreri (strain MCA 2997) TaxID=1381753 RepID=V2XWU0_MONRO|nr:hypothetical protein Moror_264 [Moniliophthora roreri MCA 2997]